MPVRARARSRHANLPTCLDLETRQRCQRFPRRPRNRQHHETDERSLARRHLREETESTEFPLLFRNHGNPRMRQRSGECGETFRPRSRANSLGGVGDWLARLADRLGSEKFRTQGDYVGIRSQAGYSHCRFFPRANCRLPVYCSGL